MKYIIVLLTALCLVSFKNLKETTDTKGYTITGIVKGLKTGTVKIGYGLKPTDLKIIDSAKITNGVFKLKGRVDYADKVYVVINSNYFGDFFLENSAIKLDIDLSDSKVSYFKPKITGSKGQDILKEFDEKAALIYKKEKYAEIRKASEELNIARKASDKKMLDAAMSHLKQVEPLINEQQKEVKNLKLNYVTKNSKSSVAIYVMGYLYMEGVMNREELKKYYNIFSGDAAKTTLFKEHIEPVYKNAFDGLVVGSTVPDFTLTTVNNEEFTLSEEKTKYKLVDFWASWCVPCRASFPHLIELREKYIKEDFKVIGVATADVEDKWRKAIMEDKTPWTHVLDVSENHAYGTVANAYGVPHLPTTFLIDNNFKIILRNPSKKELADKLEELFGY